MRVRNSLIISFLRITNKSRLKCHEPGPFFCPTLWLYINDKWLFPSLVFLHSNSFSLRCDFLVIKCIILILNLTNIYTHVPPTLIKIQIFPLLQEVPSCFFPVNVSSPIPKYRLFCLLPSLSSVSYHLLQLSANLGAMSLSLRWLSILLPGLCSRTHWQWTAHLW